MKVNPNISSGQWTLNGKNAGQTDPVDGTLKESLNLQSVNYTAPQKVPSNNPVTVNITFKPSDTSKMILMLTCNITITDVENYVYFNTPYCMDYLEFVDPKNEFAKEQMSSIAFVNGLLHIHIFGGWVKDPSDILNMSLVTNGNAPGTYKWKYPGGDNVVINVACSNYKGNPVQVASTDCIPNHDKDCQAISLEGSTTITTYNTQKKILQGYFSGGVLGILHNQYYYGSVYGRFTCHLK
jgi:hypothetical protein